MIRRGLLVVMTLCVGLAQKEQPTFKSGVELVMAAVVVHDSQGRATGDLRAEDFAIFDKGKPQKITSFTVEHIAAAKTGDTIAPAETATVPAERYLAFVFDDLQLKGETFIRVVQAARAYLDTLRAGDHAAILTTSGAVTLPFTSSKEQLHATLQKLSPWHMEDGRRCPDLSLYEADLILNKKDNDAIMAAIYEVQACNPGLPVAAANANNPPRPGATNDIATETVAAAAKAVFMAGEQRSRAGLNTLRNVVEYLSTAPGQRILVLASPGFLVPAALEKDALMDRAIRNQVVIDSLDARGLYANPGLDITKHIGNVPSMSSFPYASVKGDLATRGSRAQSNVLAELAYGTGGTFFENNNDLVEGFRQVSAAPEYLYLIGFTPEKLKRDGSFHPLKVEVKNQPQLKVHSARKGYYAPEAN